MRQCSLFDDREDDAALAGLVANVRAALNRAVGQDKDGRKLLVDRINAIARSGSPPAP